jgi:prepilin-type N-terminal cleavage/methylation domain-containing protein
MMFKNLVAKTRSRRAFSLIELSIVIVIVGILIAGLGKSNFLVRQYRLSNAQSLTRGAPVNRVNNLMLWLESTSEQSIAYSEATDNSAVTTWYDLDSQSNIKNNATSSGTARPFYISNCMNNLPCLRFDGNNDYLAFDGSSLVNSNYTIFVVEQRKSDKITNYFIGGSGSTSGTNLSLGYEADTTLRTSHYGNDLDYTVSAYSVPTPTIHTVVFDKISGKRYWFNGGSTADGSNSNTTAVSSYANSALGRIFSTSFFNGDLAEVIIFDESLQNRERQAIESYLGKKWKISVPEY